MDPFVKSRIVPDTWIDVNEMMGLSGKYAIKGLGHTAHQMKEAPQNAIFVWCNEKTSYPKELAKHLGREDLEIQESLWLFAYAHFSAHRTPIVVDHTYKPPKFR